MTNKKPKGAFETADIRLNMRSANLHTVTLRDITPAEFLMLQHIHGKHAPEVVAETGPAILKRMDETGKWLKKYKSEADVLEALTLKYGEPNVAKVFPGANPVLPKNFADIDTSTVPEEDDEMEGWVAMDDDEIGPEEEKVEEKAGKGKGKSPKTTTFEAEDDLIGDDKKAADGKKS